VVTQRFSRCCRRNHDNVLAALYVRELLRENYTAFYVFDANVIGKWQELDAAAATYLSDVVK